MIRRLITFVIAGLAFYGGLQAERFLHQDRCLDAGGSYGADRVCRGAQ